MTLLAGKVAVVTGAASGIGRASAASLARRGMRVVVADIDAGAAETAAAAIRGDGGTAVAMSCDVAAENAFPVLRDAVAKHWAPADIVMNNAGILLSGRPEEIPLAVWEQVFEVNLLSVVRSMHAFVPEMIARGSGHFVNTASFAGLFAYAWDRIPYGTAKAAVIALSEAYALYLKPQGIGVTCLCPGPVLTNIAKSARSYGPPSGTRNPGRQFALLAPEAVGEMVADAVEADRFFLPTDDLVRPIMVERANDPDAFLAKTIVSMSSE